MSRRRCSTTARRCCSPSSLPGVRGEGADGGSTRGASCDIVREIRNEWHAWWTRPRLYESSNFWRGTSQFTFASNEGGYATPGSPFLLSRSLNRCMVFKVFSMSLYRHHGYRPHHPSSWPVDSTHLLLSRWWSDCDTSCCLNSFPPSFYYLSLVFKSAVLCAMEANEAAHISGSVQTWQYLEKLHSVLLTPHWSAKCDSIHCDHIRNSEYEVYKRYWYPNTASGCSSMEKKYYKGEQSDHEDISCRYDAAEASLGVAREQQLQFHRHLHNA